MMVYEPSTPPEHLSASAKEWWRSTTERYELEPHHLRLLQLCLEAWDRCQMARARLAEDGLTVTASDGGVKAHPAVRDSRLAVARILRELDLDVTPPVGERIAPPPLRSNNRGRRAS